jgi:glycerol-3-phosphate O-acyltransferase
MRKQDKERVLIEVTSRTVNAVVRSARSGGLPLENLLNDALFNERKRLEKEAPSGTRRADLAFWKEVQHALLRSNEDQLRDLLRRVVQRYILEIMGNFNEQFYQLTTKLVPVGLMGLFNGLSPKKLLAGASEFPKVEDKILVRGATADLTSLAQKGTVILAPTHASHLDSIVVGWALYHLGLPPFLYGAGLNLFANPVVGFFMGNLGAYRVDRKKQHALYKDVLKEYATYTLEIGYHHLFFPGGTRSRSGAVEQKLKLGLLGTGLQAYIHNLIAQRAKPNVYVVPCTVNFPLVLEAETLIDDYLKEAGKAQYIITDDEFSRPRRVIEFMKEVTQLDAGISIEIAPPLDPFGNSVDAQGRSLDARGREIDISQYVKVGSGPAHDVDRDAQYTRELGDAVARAFRQHAVLWSTHVVAFATFRLFRARNPELDLYRLLRTGGSDDSLPLADLYVLVDRALEELRVRASKGLIRLATVVERASVTDVVADALRMFGTYHTHPALVRRGDRLFSEDMNLLYYYHNRLTGLGLDKLVDSEARRKAA